MFRPAMLLSALLFALPATVLADELADGMKAWERQDYQQAHAIFSKLAAAGNPEAQRQLGEMIGFGDGVPEDLAKAEEWLTRAQANGSKEAAASLQTLHQRAARKADIAFYVSKYDGAELGLGRYGCVKPHFPIYSETKADIRKTAAAMSAWQACYQRFVAGLGAALPPGKAIPEDVANIMSVTEFAAAKARMEQVYTALAADAKQQATSLVAANDTWVKETEVYAKGQKLSNDHDIDELRRIKLARRYGAKSVKPVTAPPPAPSTGR
jgi:uncharacterized protein